MPVVFIPHGGGPWPILDMGFDPAERQAMLTYLQSLAKLPPTPPRAVLIVSAHWEAPEPTLSTSPNPPMLFDYYGFPSDAYALDWPAPGAPHLAERVRGLLRDAAFACAEDPARGYDHGVFVPMLAAYPNADMPTLPLSLVDGLDAALHVRLGAALAPLRDEGVFIVCGGNSYHNLRAFGRPAARAASATFDAWLNATMKKPAQARNADLVQWAQAPAARDAHPREEHLLPLMVASGAAGDDPAEVGFNGVMMGAKLTAFHFGNTVV